jgi:hypothetical protein
VEVPAVELARQHVDEDVAAFEREGEASEEASAVAADVAAGKMHAAAARKAL